MVVDVSAPWCPTCRAQAPIVRSLLKEPRFKDLVLVHVLGHVNQLPCALGMQQLLLQGIAMELKVISDCS